MRVGQEGFGALRSPFDRPFDLLGRPRADSLLVVDENLGAEAAANVGRDDAQLVLGRDALKRGQDNSREMRILACRIERGDVNALVIVAESRARLHGVGNEAVVDEIELGDVCGFGEGGFGRRLVAQMPVAEGVVGRKFVHLRRARLGRASRIDHRRQNSVVDSEFLRPVARLQIGVRDDDGDRVADIERFSMGKGGKRARFHWRAVFEIDCHAPYMRADLVGDGVGAGEHGDYSGGLQCGRSINLVDRRMRMGRTNEKGVGLARTVEIVDVMALAGDEADVFRALNRGANAGRAHDVSLPWNGLKRAVTRRPWA